MIQITVTDPRLLDWNEKEFGLSAPLIRSTQGSAAYDLRACTNCDHLLWPGEELLVSAGFKLHMSPDTCALILARSGKSIYHGLVMANCTGLIDSDYQDEVKIPIWMRRDIDSEGVTSLPLSPGDRIAQILFLPVITFDGAPVVSSQRTGGLGSTDEEGC